MVVCLTSARFNMKADILRQSVSGDPVNVAGEWKNQQDPNSGELIRVWIPITVNDPDTPESDVEQATFRCLARAIIEGGIRVAGINERFGELYEGTEYIVMWFPPNVRMSRRDRITNVRDKHGTVIWIEEEREDLAPTVFSVRGVTPILDPFGKHVESMAVLERVETQ